ncbi:hypothetical protein [Actinokineospora sp. NPDC004072]
MSHEGGSERTQQRTVAELLAKYGGSSEGGAPRRRRRRPDDVSDTAPQAIIERVMSDSGELPVVRDDQEPPTRTSHRQARPGRRAAPPQQAEQQPPPRRAPRPDAPEPMTEQLPRVPPSARRRRQPDEPAAEAPPRALPPERRPEPPAAPPRRVAAALEGTQRGIPALDDPDDDPPPNGRGTGALPRRAPGGSRMPQRAPKPIPPPPAPPAGGPKQPSGPLPKPQPSQPLPVQQVAHPAQQTAQQLPVAPPSQQLPAPLPPQPSQQLPKPFPQPSQQLAKPPLPPSGPATEVSRPVRPGDFPGDSAQTEIDPQAPPPEFLEEHEGFDDKAARRFDGYTAHDDLESPPADDELDGFADLDELTEDDEPDEEEVSPAKAWLTMIAQLALGVVGGAAVWLGFNWLWGFQPVAALVAAVLVIAGLVFIVRKIRRAEDLNTTILAVLVGLVVTVSPAALLIIGH